MNGCILWTGPVNVVSGYGVTATHVPLYAHRVAWEQAHGPIPEGMQVDHLCRVRTCINVEHMQLLDPSTHGTKSNADRWTILGDSVKCRHGHIGERAMTRRGTWYCRACNRERQRQRRKEVV